MCWLVFCFCALFDLDVRDLVLRLYACLVYLVLLWCYGCLVLLGSLFLAVFLYVVCLLVKRLLQRVICFMVLFWYCFVACGYGWLKCFVACVLVFG